MGLDVCGSVYSYSNLAAVKIQLCRHGALINARLVLKTVL